MSSIITALDIGSSQIKVIVSEKKKNGNLGVISVFKFPSSGVRRGLVVDTDDFVANLRELVSDLQKISRRAAENVFVNVNSDQIKTHPSKGFSTVARADREIQQDDIDHALQIAKTVNLPNNFMVLHNITREFFIDDIGDVMNPLGMTGNRLEVGTLIIEAFIPQYETLMKSLKKAGVRVSGPIFNPLATARAVLSKKQKELGVLMIDFGFGTTSISVFEDGKAMHAKTFPIGASLVTNDIAIGLKTSVDIAEKLKLSYGSALAKEVSRREKINMSEFEPSNKNEIDRRFLSEIIEIRLAELLELINNELKALGRVAQLPAGVVVTGGGMKLPGLVELVKGELKLAVQEGFPNLAFFDVQNPAHKEMLDDPEFGTAVGLALWGKDIDRGSGSGAAGLFLNFLRNLKP